MWAGWPGVLGQELCATAGGDLGLVTELKLSVAWVYLSGLRGKAGACEG